MTGFDLMDAKLRIAPRGRRFADRRPLLAAPALAQDAANLPATRRRAPMATASPTPMTLPPTRTASAGAPEEQTAEDIVVTGFRASLTAALERQARRDRHHRRHQGRGHRRLPRQQPRRIDPAHSGRRHQPRPGRRPQHHRARPRPGLHPRAHQRHRGRSARPAAPTPAAAPTAAARSTSTSSPPSCSTRSRCARPPRPMSRKARSAPPSICRRRGRSTIATTSPSSARRRSATTTSPTRSTRASPPWSRPSSPTASSASCSRPPIASAASVEEGPSTVRWERGTDNGGFAPASTLPAARRQGFAFFHPRIPRYDSYRYTTERLGLTGSLQFAADRRTLLTLRRALCATSSRTAPSNISRRSRSAARAPASRRP